MAFPVSCRQGLAVAINGDGSVEPPCSLAAYLVVTVSWGGGTIGEEKKFVQFKSCSESTTVAHFWKEKLISPQDFADLWDLECILEKRWLHKTMYLFLYIYTNDRNVHS